MKIRQSAPLALGLVLTVIALLIVTTARADAAATRIEPRDRDVARHLAYVEPMKVTKRGNPRLLYAEFTDGSTWVLTPCKYEDSRNCFWWAPTRGNRRGWSFIDLRGKTFYL